MKNKNIVLGVCGGIAAYKAADLCSRLKKNGYAIDVIMTQSAQEFVRPLTFQSLAGSPVVCDTFDAPKNWDVKHISLAEKADLMVIAPATANIIGKVASGIADDMLSTTIMAASCPVLFAPAMNTHMYENPIVQANIQKLKQYGYLFVEPGSGRLACGAVGKGRLPDTDILMQHIESALWTKKDLQGLRILVTAGPTKEYIDPVRYISNPSSGKMGYAVAKAAAMRGAKVTLVSGPVQCTAPEGVELIPVISALEMYDAVMGRVSNQDIIIKAAAVGDFRPQKVWNQKMKKDAIHTIELIKNPDILQAVCEKKEKRIVIGFCMETQNLARQAYEKLLRKGADMIVANNVAEPDSGFATDTNRVLFVYPDGTQKQLDTMPKEALAHQILDAAMKIQDCKRGE